MSDLLTAIASARRQSRSGAGAVLDILRRGLDLDDDELCDALRRDAGVLAFVEPAGLQPRFDLISREQARALCAIAVDLPGSAPDARHVAMADPWDDDRLRAVSVGWPRPPVALAVTDEMLGRWLGEGGEEARPPRSSAAAASTSARAEADGPVVAFVEDAIRAAHRSGASDIHFICDRQGVRVKHRLDGVLVNHARWPDVRKGEEVISRLKVLAQLDVTERRVPQDGRMRLELGGHGTDLRVSIMPSVFGENAVLRLLDKSRWKTASDVISLHGLGFRPDDAERIRDLSELPHGMVLVTGPTGSGKTTTVYAVLSETQRGEENIVTIEDPVEYELPDVLQIPVNERKGLTFAKGLRSILRHDPDRILVGEIRDAETAEIAIQSALTGHPVFTTVHANSLFDVTGRFRHFGLDMFSFMAALNGVVVQRLLRMACPACVRRRSPDARESRWLARHGLAPERVPEAVGCESCHGSGYAGRRVMAEVHAIDDRFRDLVTEGASVGALRAHVASSGVVPLARQACDWVVEGLTTADEVRRIVGWE